MAEKLFENLPICGYGKVTPENPIIITNSKFPDRCSTQCKYTVSTYMYHKITFECSIEMAVRKINKSVAIDC